MDYLHFTSFCGIFKPILTLTKKEKSKIVSFISMYVYSIYSIYMSLDKNDKLIPIPFVVAEIGSLLEQLHKE